MSHTVRLLRDSSDRSRLRQTGILLAAARAHGRRRLGDPPCCGDVRGQGLSRLPPSAAALRDRQSATATSRRTLAAIALCPLSGVRFGRMGAPAMELLNTLSIHASASGTVVKGLRQGECLARAQCEPVQGNGTMFRAGLMVTARCSARFQRRRLCAFC
jgi:hypothetical protein